MIRIVLASLLLFLLAVRVGPLHAQDSPPTVIVIDSSGSMAAALSGKTRLDAARGVLDEILVRWPRSAPLGVVAYGHRRTSDCADIEVLAPIGPPDAASLKRRYAGLMARGKTPLAASLQQAASMLREVGKGGTIILVTDGIETCHPDPCAVARALRAADATLSVHVVGFAVEAKDEKQLSCIAQAGGGQYRTAANAAGLLDGLRMAARAATEAPPTPPPAPAPPSPQKIAEPEPVRTAVVSFVAVVKEGGPLSDHAVDWKIDGKQGPDPFRYEGSSSVVELTLPAGGYEVQAAAANTRTHVEVTLEGGAKRRIEVPLDAGWLAARVIPYRGAEPIDDHEALAWSLTPLDGQAAVPSPAVAKPTMLLAAGRYRVQVAHRGRRAEAEASIASGRRLDLELDLRLGELHLSAALAEGAEPLTEWRGLAWRVLAPDGTVAADAEQQAAPLVVLPAGRYRVELTAAGITVPHEAEVIEGVRQEARLLVPTGTRVLAAALAPGREPLDDWRDVSWTVKAVDAVGVAAGTAVLDDQPAATPTVKLLPGRWQVVARSGPVSAEREIVVATSSEEEVRLDLQAARLQVMAAPADGEPPSNIVFEILPVATDGSLGPSVFSVGNAREAGSLLGPGRWRISADDDHGRRAEATVDLRAGEDRKLDLTLR